LHALAHDTQAFEPNIVAAVDDMIETLRNLPAGVTVRGMPWPLFIGGCMASSIQQQFFDDILERNLEEAGTAFTNFGSVKMLLHFVWSGEHDYFQTGRLSRCWSRAMADTDLRVLMV
jgi:hypothetical protein